MKRADLLALAEQIEARATFHTGMCDNSGTRAAAILRQIAQSQSVGWACTQKNGDNRVFAEPCLSSNPEYVKLHHDYNWRKVYTLPLED